MVDNYFRDLLKVGYKNEISGRTEQKNTTIHASDIFNFCPRRFCLCLEHDIPFHVNEYIGNSLALTFDIGRKIQDIVIERIMKSGKLIGTWVCECGHIYFGFKEKTCPKCKRFSPKYKDTQLKLHIAKQVSLVGNVDIMIVKDKNIYIGEIKSIKKDEYNNLSEPLINHKFQIMTYLFMLNQKRVLVNNVPLKQVEEEVGFTFEKLLGAVIYIPKESVKDPFEKIFSQQLENDFVEGVYYHLNAVERYLNNKKIPKNIYCTSELSIMARGCNVRKICLR